MKRFLVRIFFEMAKRLDFTYLQVLTMNHFDKVSPDIAKDVYEIRVIMLKNKEDMRKFRENHEEDD